MTFANRRLRALYEMQRAIGAERRLGPLLEAVTRGLVDVAGVCAVAVKLLDEDGRRLSFVGGHGLPEKLIEDRAVELSESAADRRVIETRNLVIVPDEDSGTLQMSRELADLGFGSAIVAPLEVQDRILGTLSFYRSTRLEPVDERDRDLLLLAAGLVAIAVDHARAHESIAQLVRDRTHFMLEVAHNLRAPLSASLGIIELLEGAYLGELEPRQAEQIERLRERLEGLDASISDLLAIARTRDRSREIPDVLVDVNALATAMAETFRPEADRRGLELTVEAEADLPRIETGEGILERVLENLVSNALKYTPEGGRVGVRFELLGKDSVRITVEDTGIGIPGEERRHLFREFFRASNARKVASGTGLGLVLVHKAVERHGGDLAIEPREGGGTRVVVDLPCRCETPSKTPPRVVDIARGFPLGSGATR